MTTGQTVMVTLTPNEALFLNGALLTTIVMMDDETNEADRAVVIRMCRELMTRIREAFEGRIVL